MQTRKLAQGAIAVALATVLSFITLFKAPYGGSVTAASMVPIILYSYMYGPKWGVMASGAYVGIQMITGFYAPPAPTLGRYFLMILFDYVIAFGVLGLASSFGKPFGKYAMPVGTAAVLIIRYLSHIASGVLIWDVYAPEGQSALVYSLLYNGGYMLMEIVISVAVMVLLMKSVSLERLRGEAAVGN